MYVCIYMYICVCVYVCVYIYIQINQSMLVFLLFKVDRAKGMLLVCCKILFCIYVFM